MNWSNELEVHQCWISTSIHQDVYASSSASIHGTMKSRVSICILVNVQCTVPWLHVVLHVFPEDSTRREH